MTPPLDPKRLLRTLDRHGVRYLLVGGLAAVAHGWPGTTAVVVPVMALDDLIRTKRELGRPKDLRVAIELEQLRDDQRR